MAQQISRMVDERECVDACTAAEVLECPRLQVEETQLLRMVGKISEDDLADLRVTKNLFKLLYEQINSGALIFADCQRFRS